MHGDEEGHRKRARVDYYALHLQPAHDFLAAIIADNAPLSASRIPTAAQVDAALANPPPLPLSQSSMDLFRLALSAASPTTTSEEGDAVNRAVCLANTDAFPGCSDFLWFDVAAATVASEEERRRDRGKIATPRCVQSVLDAVWPRASVVRPVPDGADIPGYHQTRVGPCMTFSRVNEDRFTLTVLDEHEIDNGPVDEPAMVIPPRTGPQELSLLHKDTESVFVLPYNPRMRGGVDAALLKLAEGYAPNAVLTGDAPFIPVVAFGPPYTVHFALLVPDADTAFATFKPTRVGRELDLRQPLDRVRLVASMGMYYELWRKLVALWPSEAWPCEKPFPGSRVRVVRRQLNDQGKQRIYMLKMVNSNDFHLVAWDEVISLYDVAHEVPFLIRAHSAQAPSPTDCLCILNVYPVGHARQPRDFAELRTMAQCVLKSLQGMHARRFVHRDVRPPNVVRLSDGSWWLIDVERARKCNEDTFEAPWPEDYTNQFLPNFVPLEDEDEEEKNPYAGVVICRAGRVYDDDNEEEEEDEAVDDGKRWFPAHDVWQLAKSARLFAKEMMESTEDDRLAGERLALAIWRASWPEGEEPVPKQAPVGRGDDGLAATRALAAMQDMV